MSRLLFLAALAVSLVAVLVRADLHPVHARAADAPALAASVDPTPNAPAALTDAIEAAASGTAAVPLDGLAEAVAAALTEDDKLTASDGAQSDQFGVSVSLSGDRALVGAPGDRDAGFSTGSAHVFDLAACGSACNETSKLTASDGAEFDRFGGSVSLSSDRALVGASGDDDNGPWSGSVYVFEVAACGATCTETQKLLPSDGVAVDYFGTSVSLDGGRALIGAPNDDGGPEAGKAYVFAFDGTIWAEEALLTSSDAEAQDGFGRSVSLSGDRALVGAFRDDDAGTNSGPAYVFAFDGASWSQEFKLTASDAAEFDEFGTSVSLSGDQALVAAAGDDDDGSSSGSAYTFGLTACEPGTFSGTGSAPCTPAPPGFFVAEAGATEATPAPLGTFVDQEGAVQATACAVGRYQPEAGQTSCLPAPVGFYVDVTGAAAATACPDGQTTLVEGSASADACFDPNRPPVAVATGPEAVIAGQTVTLDGSASTDPDGDPLTYAWTLDGPALSGADTATPIFCAADAGDYTATLVVNDGTVDSEAASVTVTALSATQALDALAADVAATPGLNGGQTNALTRKLEQAQRKLARGQDPAGQLGAFRSQVLSLEAEGVLDPTDAAALVASVDAIAGAVAAPCTEAAASEARVASAVAEATAEFGLEAPYPNPASGRATVGFSVAEAGPVRLAVYDALGREVAVLVDRGVSAGRHEAVFDGPSLVAGTYLVRLSTAGGAIATQRLTLLR